MAERRTLIIITNGIIFSEWHPHKETMSNKMKQNETKQNEKKNNESL